MADLKELQKQVTDLIGTVDVLNKSVENLTATASEQAQQIATLKKENEALAKVPENANKPAKPLVIPTTSFSATGEDKKYVFTSAKFIVPAKKGGRATPLSITAEDALTDQAILNELIASNSGVIKELV